jgi:hypothetical protein
VGPTRDDQVRYGILIGQRYNIFLHT